ncbi:hypothetical protein B484DRAFT_151361 [Ochromonadaceae sp. CCMP2298]|nr:hypothetical protein B484DRAFT_151361 [Ochromonadaceae sp. CCMP2298]
MSTTVFVGNLAWTTTNTSLDAFASAAGPVLSAEVKCHPGSKRSKGWGLINYSDVESANNAVEQLNGMDLEGRAVHLRSDRTSVLVDESTVSIYIGNLAWSVTKADVEELLLPFQPSDCKILTNTYGRSRGFATVSLKRDVAEAALQALSGLELQGRLIEVSPTPYRLPPSTYPYRLPPTTYLPYTTYRLSHTV